MTTPKRVSPEEVRRLDEAIMLVCAYRDKEKCDRLSLDGSISLTELESRLSEVPKDRLLVFY